MTKPKLGASYDVYRTVFATMTDTTERPAELGELCTCGRQARIVYTTERWGEVGGCGIDDAGLGGPRPCPFCGDPDGAAGHDGRCPDYRVRP